MHTGSNAIIIRKREPAFPNALPPNQRLEGLLILLNAIQQLTVFYFYKPCAFYIILVVIQLLRDP